MQRFHGSTGRWNRQPYRAELDRWSDYAGVSASDIGHRALARKAEVRGSSDFSPLWSGQNASGCKEISAGQLPASWRRWSPRARRRFRLVRSTDWLLVATETRMGVIRAVHSALRVGNEASKQEGNRASGGRRCRSNSGRRTGPLCCGPARNGRKIRGIARDAGSDTGRPTIADRVLGGDGQRAAAPLRSSSEVRAAYANRPLPIGHGQTISQPYIVAVMTELHAIRNRRQSCWRSAPAPAIRQRCWREMAHVVHDRDHRTAGAAGRGAAARAEGYTKRADPDRRRLFRLGGVRPVRRDPRHRCRGPDSAAAGAAAEAGRPHGDPGRRAVHGAAPDARRKGRGWDIDDPTDHAGAVRASDRRRVEQPRATHPATCSCLRITVVTSPLAAIASSPRDAGLRNSADAPVLDHPVAPFRLHDDQRRDAGLRRRRHVRRDGAAHLLRAFAAAFVAAAALFGVTAVAGFLLAQQIAVQSARTPVGSAAAVRLLRGVRAAACRSFSRQRAVPHLHPVRRRRRIASTASMLSVPAWVASAILALAVRADARACVALSGRPVASAAAAAADLAALAARCRRRCWSRASRPRRLRCRPGGWNWSVAIQGTVSQALTSGCTRVVAERSSPLGCDHRRREPARPVSARARSEHRVDARAAAATRACSPTATR